jgi:hypothetical protein
MFQEFGTSDRFPAALYTSQAESIRLLQKVLPKLGKAYTDL